MGYFGSVFWAGFTISRLTVGYWAPRSVFPSVPRKSRLTVRLDTHIALGNISNMVSCESFYSHCASDNMADVDSQTSVYSPSSEESCLTAQPVSALCWNICIWQIDLLPANVVFVGLVGLSIGPHLLPLAISSAHLAFCTFRAYVSTDSAPGYQPDSGRAAHGRHCVAVSSMSLIPYRILRSCNRSASASFGSGASIATHSTHMGVLTEDS